MNTHPPATEIGVEFRPLIIPASMDAPDAGDYAAMVAVRNQVYRELSGHDDHAMPADELLPIWQRDEDELSIGWLVLLDEHPIGRIVLNVPVEEGSRVAFASIELIREVWGRGIGTAAHEIIERTARDHGRSVLQSWAEHPDAPGERLTPPTGFGSIPLDHAARFYLRHGYSLEQIERNSVFDLRGPFDEVERLLAGAREASRDYRIVSWSPPTPPEFAEGYAWMKSRMVTDAPAAALEFDEEVWDAAKLARHDALYTSSGRTLRVVAAQHITTGELCAFNELAIGKDMTTATDQEDTLVLKGHRGHRLGMLVKCENLLAWRDIAPGSPRVKTYNAEENRPMLDINEAIGFVPIAYEGAWKKVLDD